MLITPALFSSYAVAANGAMAGWRDADLAEGTHLRVVPHRSVGLPTTPLVFWRIRVAPVADAIKEIYGGNLAAVGITPSGAGPVRVLLAPRSEDTVLVGVEAVPAGGAVRRIALLQPATGRVAMARSTAPWRVGGPLVHIAEITADGTFDLIVYAISQEGLQLPEPSQGALVGMPEFEGPWYSPRTDRPLEPSMDRVRRCAPLRPSIVQFPAGPFTPLGAAAAQLEGERIGEIEPMLKAALQQTVNAARREDRIKAQVDPARPLHGSEYVPMRSLLLQSVDPGVARYLGLMTMEPSTPADLALPHAWACAGLFALDLAEVPKAAVVQRFDEHAERARRFAARFARADAMVAAAPGLNLLPRVLSTAALVVPPPDLPPAPKVQLTWSRWIRTAGTSTEFQQGMEVPQAPTAPLVALARRSIAAWEPRNGLAVPPPDGKWQRTVLLGARRAQDGRSPPLDPGAGLLQDMQVPVSGAPWAYQLALGDLFGRFGTPTAFTVPVPPRPALPLPSVRAVPLYDTRLAEGTAPASPGKALIEVHVNSSQRQPAGALPLKTLRVEVKNAGDGSVRSIALDPASQQTYNEQFELQLKPTAPSPASMRGYKVTVTATVTDAGGNTRANVVSFDVADPRPPALPAKATALIWSSRPTAADDVQLALTLNAPAGSRWRVYITDVNTLAPQAADGPRAAAADAGAKSNSPLASSRDSFRLLTREPITAPGPLDYTTTLPRALETVQFLRFVPVTDQGAEGDFTKSPLVPVAVPRDSRPPAPRLALSWTKPDGLVQIDVLAHGMRALLEKEEPGLFTSPAAAAARPPEFRLRRASGPVADPLYARELAMGPGNKRVAQPTKWNKAENRFEGSFIDRDAKSYGLYYYWAEVRMPPERRVKVGVPEENPPGSVRGVDSSQMQDMPGLFSEASPALMVCPVPPKVPTLKASNLECSYRGDAMMWQLTLTVQGGPKTPPRAVGTFRVRTYIKTAGDGDWQALPNAVDLTDGACTVTYNGAGAVPAELRVSVELIDPVGRVAAPTTIIGERLNTS